MTLIDLIHANRVAREARPKRHPKPYLCPASKTVCSQRCYLRHECAAEPERMEALTDRLNTQTEHAMVEYVQRLRKEA